MVEYGTFAVGGSVYPVTPSTANSALQDLDQPLFYLLDFYAGVLDIHLGERWNNECARALRPDLAPTGSDGYLVSMKVPYNPEPFKLSTGFKFPLLAMYRRSGTMLEKSRAWYRIQSDVGLLWILPPVTAAQAEYLLPFQSSVMRVLQDRTEQGWDPAYLSGAKIAQIAGFDSLACTEYAFDHIPVEDAKTNSTLYFPTVALGLQLRERNMPVSDEFSPFTGSDISETLVNPDPAEQPIPDFVDFKAGQ